MGCAGHAGWVPGVDDATRPDPGYHPTPAPGINPANPYRTLGAFDRYTFDVAHLAWANAILALHPHNKRHSRDITKCQDEVCVKYEPY